MTDPEPDAGGPTDDGAPDPSAPLSPALPPVIPAPRTPVTRRGLLLGGAAGAAGALAAGVGFGAGLKVAEGAQPAPQTPTPTGRADKVPFDGIHQSGIATPPQAHALLLAFDAGATPTAMGLSAILREWTRAGRALAQGETTVDPTMISAGSRPAGFTMTVGVGGTLLDRLGIPRPAGLVDLPTFPGDQLIEQDSGGDIVVQLCSDDALVVAGAARTLRAVAGRHLTPRWQFTGFRGTTSAETRTNGRNLMGQIDGTNNIAVSPSGTGGTVWVDAAEPGWFTDGTYLAVRRFRMLLNQWEGAAQHARDDALGRHQKSGAPLGGKSESDPVDLDAVNASGAPVVPLTAHVRLAKPTTGAGEELLRRSYSYSNPPLPDGQEDAGLLFLSYQSDPRTSFIPVQQRLAEKDGLNQFTLTTASSLFAILPGTSADSWLGKSLFDSV